MFLNLSAAVNFTTNNNYKIKKQIVNYILEDTREESFNVYYDLPQGQNTGYKYLFKANRKTAQEGGKNLYILEGDLAKNKYEIVFPDKKISSRLIGFVYIVSVK